MFGFAPLSTAPLSALTSTQPSLTAATGTFVLTGSAIGVELRRTSSTGSFVLTGNAAAFVRAQTLVGEVGTFILTGQSAAQIQQRSSASGTFVLTGNAALVVRGVVLNASRGTFALTGQAATFGLGRRITAARGTSPTLTSTASRSDMFVFYTNTAGTTWYAMTAAQNFVTT